MSESKAVEQQISRGEVSNQPATRRETARGVDKPSFGQQLLLQDRSQLTRTIAGLRGEQELFRRTGRDASEVVKRVQQAEARKQLLIDDGNAGGRAGSRSDGKEIVARRLEDIERRLAGVSDAEEGNDYYVRRGLEIRRYELLMRREAFSGVENPSFKQGILIQDVEGLGETIQDLRERARTATGDTRSEVIRQIQVAEARKRLFLSDRSTESRGEVEAKLADIRRRIVGVRGAEEGNEWYVRRGLENRRRVLEGRLEELNYAVKVADLKVRGYRDPEGVLRGLAEQGRPLTGNEIPIEEELRELAERLAKEAYEQGEGFLGISEYSSRITRKGDHVHVGSVSVDRIAGFAEGTTINSKEDLLVLANDFKHSNVSLQLKPGEQGVIIKPFVFIDEEQEQTGISKLLTIRRRQPVIAVASSYEFRMPLVPSDDVSRDLIFHFAVTDDIAGGIDAALAKDPRFMDAFFHALYPDILKANGFNVQTANALVISDFREMKPNSDKIGATPYPERVNYPQEITY